MTIIQILRKGDLYTVRRRSWCGLWIYYGLFLHGDELGRWREYECELWPTWQPKEDVDETINWLCRELIARDTRRSFKDAPVSIVETRELCLKHS